MSSEDANRLPRGVPRVYRYEDLCEELKITNGTLRQYLANARRNRAQGICRAWDMPEPDAIVAHSPVWFGDTVDSWLRARPSKGHGLTSPGHGLGTEED